MNRRLNGILLALTGGTLWGFSGVCGQYAFQIKNAPPEWISSWRLLISGLILLAIAFCKYKGKIFKVFGKKTILPMLIFSFVSVLGCQYSYFMSIAYSNSATATVLQYIAPALVMLFVCFAGKTLPTKTQLTALAGAMLGVFFMATGGSIHSLSISGTALFWGLFSGFCYAVYTVQCPSLSSLCGIIPMLGWGNLIGSIPLLIFNKEYVFSYSPDLGVLLALFGTAIVGTIFAYSLYVRGCQITGPVTGSLCSSIEPLSSAVISCLWLGTQFKTSDYIGLILIVGAVVMITLNKRPTKKTANK